MGKTERNRERDRERNSWTLNIPLWKLCRLFRKLAGQAMSAVQIIVWHKCFKGGRESVESDPRSGRPETSRTPESVQCVWAVIKNDQRLTVWELEADLGIPKTTVSEILTQDLGMKCVVAKLVPQLLLPEQKEHCAAVADELMQIVTRFPQESHNWRWTVGFQLWSRNEDPVTPMEVTWFFTPKEGTAKSQQDQDHTLGKVLSIMSITLQAKQLIRSTTSKFFICWEMQ